MRVLYLVNRMAPESIPLEVTHYLVPSAIDLHIAVYYDEGRDVPTPDLATTHFLQARSAADVTALSRLAALIRNLRPDILHVHHTFSAAVGLLIGKALRVPGMVKTEHNDHAHYRLHQTALNLFSLALADVVTCNSATTLNSFHRWERFVTHNKTRVIYNGIDFSAIRRGSEGTRANARSGLGIPEGAFVVGAVGRLVAQKSHLTLLRGFAQARLPESSYLLLVGGGPQAEMLRQSSEDLGIFERTRFTGSVDRAEVYALLGAMDLFAVTSLWEGFCNAAVEAMAAGLPIVGSDIETLREVVGPEGRFFEPGSADELGAALSDVAELHARERRAWGHRCAEWAEATYAIEATAQAYVGTYQQLERESWRMARH